MKVSDFRLLCDLPKEFEYELFKQNNNDILVVGKNNQAIILFIIHENKLLPITIDEAISSKVNCI